MADIKRIVGFALLAETGDGRRIMVYSDEITDAVVEAFNRNNFDLYSAHSDLRFEVKIDARSMNISFESEPIELILNQPPKLLTGESETNK